MTEEDTALMVLLITLTTFPHSLSCVGIIEYSGKPNKFTDLTEN